MGETWKRLTLTYRIAAISWAALVGLAAALQAADLVPSLPRIEPFVWAISLGFIAVDNVGVLISRRLRRDFFMREDALRTALTGLLIQLSNDDDKVRFQELGASIYLIPSLKSRLKWWRTPELERALRVRPAGYPQKSGVTWTSGKGNVGTCWAQGSTQYMNCFERAKTWSGNAPTVDEFNRLPEAERSGMTYNDFVRIADKYAEVIAEPIWDRRNEKKLVGVLSVDRAHKTSDGRFVAQLGEQETRDATAATASMVGRILKPRSQQA